MSIQRTLYLERMKKLVEMDPKKHVKKNPENGMFCVYDKSGKKVKEFKSEADANKYATDNHDALMKENDNPVDKIQGNPYATGPTSPLGSRKKKMKNEDVEQVDEMMPHGMNLSVKSIEKTPSMIAYRKKVKQDHEKRMAKLKKERGGTHKQPVVTTTESEEKIDEKETTYLDKKRNKRNPARDMRKAPDGSPTDGYYAKGDGSHAPRKPSKYTAQGRRRSVNPKYGDLQRAHESVELSEADKVMINELFLFITNDAQLYRQRITPLIKNYQRKMKKGIFDQEMAVKGFLYAVNDGIKKYNKEFGAGSMKLSKQEKDAVATKLLDYYQEELAGG